MFGWVCVYAPTWPGTSFWRFPFLGLRLFEKWNVCVCVCVCVCAHLQDPVPRFRRHPFLDLGLENVCVCVCVYDPAFVLVCCCGLLCTHLRDPVPRFRRHPFSDYGLASVCVCVCVCLCFAILA